MFLKTFLKGFNKLVEGFPQGLPIVLYGAPGVGKTLLGLEMCYDVMAKTGSNSLVIDTEGGVDVFLAKWDDVFRAKHNVPEDLKVHVLKARSLTKLLELHGIKMKLNLASGGKVENVVTGFTSNAVENYVKRNDVKFLVYDSITAPLHLAYGRRRVNFPSRADAVSMLMNSVLSMCDSLPLYVLTIHHQSVDPANPFAKPTLPLGSALQHMIKIWLYMDTCRKKNYGLVRRLWLVRWFDGEGWNEKAYLKLDKNGWRDVDVKE